MNEPGRCDTRDKAEACTRHDSLKKWFVYQSTEKHDELKTACFERVTGERELAVEIRFSL